MKAQRKLAGGDFAHAVAGLVIAALLSMVLASPAQAVKFHPSQTPLLTFGPKGCAVGSGGASGFGDISGGKARGETTILAAGTGDLVSGSTAVSNLAISNATGSGEVVSGSNIIQHAVAATGAFVAGQSISGPGIAAGTQVNRVFGENLTLTKKATSTSASASLMADGGEFQAGESITGNGIPAGTTIAAVAGGTLTLSNPVETGKGGTGVSLLSGSRTVTNVVMTQGAFQVGHTLVGGTGFPVGATVTAVTSTTVTLSEGVTAAGAEASFRAGSSEVTSLSVLCGEFEVGQELSPATSAQGAAIEPEGIEITAVGAGTLTLSRPLVGTGVGVLLSAGPKFPNANQPNDVAIDQQRQRLYVLTFHGQGNPAEIFGFDISNPGTYPQPLSGFDPLVTPTLGSEPRIAVDNSGSASQGNIYVSSQRIASPPLASEIYGFDSSGAALSGFPVKLPDHEPGEGVKEGGKEKGNAVAIAVDPGGIVWAANENPSPAHAWLDRYSSTGGGLLSETEITEQAPKPRALAFDSVGNLFVKNGSTVWRYRAPSYEGPTQFLQSIPAETLTVDPGDDSIYVGMKEPRRILRFDSEGNLLEEFDDPSKEGVTGISNATKNPDKGLAVDSASGWLYTADSSWSRRVNVFDTVEVPTARTRGVSSPGAAEVTLNGTVLPEGISLTECHFEYVTQAAFESTGFENLSSGGSPSCQPPAASIPADSKAHSVSASVTGLDPSTLYRFRLVAANANGADPGRALSFRLGSPNTETVGSLIRSANGAQLNGRLYAHGLPSRYHFEYGSSGPCDSNPCISTATHEAAGEEWQLVSQGVSGLRPGTTYYYRLVAENDGPDDGVSVAASRRLTTRASDAPLSHGHYPGPPDSDRAWEQVSMADAGGNPVAGALAAAADGNSVVYQVLGGTSISQGGTTFNDFYARRPVGEHPTSSWETRDDVYPRRSQAPYSGWLPPSASDDLSSLLAMNTNTAEPNSPAGVWRISPGGSPRKLYDVAAGDFGTLYLFSADGSRALMVLKGSFDPEHPSPSGIRQLYDVSSGMPKLVGLLPGGSVPTCGTPVGEGGTFVFPQNAVRRASQWVSSDGSRAFFPTAENGHSCTESHLYMRDFAAAETTRIDPPPVSGPECPAAFIRATSDAVFFWTQARLDASDNAVTACATGNGAITEGGDVYRYSFAGGSAGLSCLTCGSWGPADVLVRGVVQAGKSIAVAPNGSRVYFKSSRRLVEGAPLDGSYGLYRLGVAGHQLAYVGPIGDGQVGDAPLDAEGISSDGSMISFRSESAGLNALGGQQNGGTAQYYLYNDDDRSLTCASCPQDGNKPRAAVSSEGLNAIPLETGVGPNQTALAAGGGTFAFTTPTSLVSSDQNTAAAGESAKVGTDVYEWRDGRVLLVSDGLSSWPAEQEPLVSAVTPSGRDVFFVEAAKLTPDANDSYRRLYDARIGGGVDFSENPAPCSLEACQGTPKGAPNELDPGSSHFSGPGNVKEGKPRKPCKKGRRKVRRHGKVHCLKPRRHAKRSRHHRKSRTAGKQQRHRPSSDRRAAR